MQHEGIMKYIILILLIVASPLMASFTILNYSEVNSGGKVKFRIQNTSGSTIDMTDYEIRLYASGNAFPPQIKQQPQSNTSGLDFNSSVDCGSKQYMFSSSAVDGTSIDDTKCWFGSTSHCAQDLEFWFGQNGTIPLTHEGIVILDNNGTVVYGSIPVGYESCAVDPSSSSSDISSSSNVICVDSLRDTVVVYDTTIVPISVDSFYNVGVSVDSFYNVGIPLDSFYNVGVPVDSFYNVGIALDSFYNVGVPVDSFYNVGISVDSFYNVGVPVDSFYNIGIALDSFYNVGVPVDSFYNVGVAVDSLYNVGVPVDSIYTIAVAVDSFYTNPIKVDSTYTVGVPVDSMYMVGIPVDSTYTVLVEDTTWTTVTAEQDAEFELNILGNSIQSTIVDQNDIESSPILHVEVNMNNLNDDDIVILEYTSYVYDAIGQYVDDVYGMDTLKVINGVIIDTFDYTLLPVNDDGQVTTKNGSRYATGAYILRTSAAIKVNNIPSTFNAVQTVVGHRR